MFRIALFFCVCMALAPYFVNAMTDEQKAKVHEHFETIGLKCIKDIAITRDDIMQFRAKKVPTGENVPCFLACMMKDIGVLDDQGMLQKEGGLELANKIFDEPEELEKIGDFLHSCSPINSETVGDGEKGCERAMLAYKCMIDNAAKFGFEV